MQNTTLQPVVFLTETELSERWRCSRNWLRNLRCEGSGPEFHKFGRAVRYRLDDIEAYEKAGRVATR